MAKRAKLAYFDGDLLNRKMVVAKTLLKSGFLLILMLLKSGFHCIKHWGQSKSVPRPEMEHILKHGKV